MKSEALQICIFCDGKALSRYHHFDARPAGETVFSVIDPRRYSRDLLRCETCGHFYSVHQYDLRNFYLGEYVDSTYGDAGINSSFERVINLPESASDNAQRVKRISNFLASQNIDLSGLKVLDVGSGTGVFPYAMKGVGAECTVIDPDPRSVRHCRERIGVEAILGELDQISPGRLFEFIAINKVLEHVKDPVRMLAQAGNFLQNESYAYIEVPDGESASSLDVETREEFFIEHHHIFSKGSFERLIGRAGFESLELAPVRDPSGKFTLWGFIRKK